MSKIYLYGFDLSMECTGVTIFDLDSLNPVLVTSISTSHFKKSATHGQKLKYIEDEIINILEEYPPYIITIERGFSKFNLSTQVIYRVHGVVNKLFHQVDQIYYPPKTVKEAICRGDATKKYVQDTIHKQYSNIEFKNEDESDSFAVALTYLIKTEKIEWIKPLSKKKCDTTKKKIKN
ncbi:crossover junction endodeoxyribonuclease RuvC [Paenibacillus sp. CFBP 13594]|uniref:crossover junction endodeoxyribonuclease RuvC n=1 Tax=Paenibacillus sp. CFBP 13594 TaxID=2774037 RepID=UPI00177FC791|nr:crossover junction endodeoxyribonuclease RuvC [Paenibacillus sp. CFBP 13594]MBD8836291.1 crossover junction endodeoxyribonuclease RuvC [Paenibacillus sp. CFBP 13594]